MLPEAHREMAVRRRYYYATFASNLAGVLGSVLAANGWACCPSGRWFSAMLWPCPGRAARMSFLTDVY